MDPVIPSAIPEGCCVFCDSPSQSVERYGKFLHHEESGIDAHYYCMLFACGLSQRGETHEGIEGFLVKDILAERKRAQKLKCRYCKKKGASVGCSVKACHQIYHYGCGVDEGAIFLFYDSFVSYCVKHRPVQKVLPSSCSPSKGTCPICMENVETSPGNSVLKTPCCKGTWLHRDCVQMQALSAGYFFRCAICNNENEFQEEMKKFGIYLPEKDADWECGGNAYQELYERHNRCDVDKCRCPRGRKYATQSGQWEVVLCDLCGSAGCHLACGGLVTAIDDWACRDCTSTFTRGFMEQNSSANGGGKEKYGCTPGSQQNRTPGPGGTRVRSAIRSQGKRPRPPSTTPRPLKKTKHSSTPLCPPLSPVSSQRSSLSSSPKSTPCQTMKFPRVSLSPTYEREDSGPGSSRGSGVGKYRELLPKLDCYVALEPTSQKVYCPNLSMPSLSPAATSAKKRKSSNKLKCKKARKLDLGSCHLLNETKTTQISSSKRQGDSIQTGNNNLSAPAVISSQIEDGQDSTMKPSWGSRLLDSVGSFLWSKSPSKHGASESLEGNQERKDTCNNSDDIQKSSLSQKRHTNVASSSSSSLESRECSLPNSNSPIALSEEIKAQIIPVNSDSMPSKTKNLLHDLTSWKDDTTWKEAKQDLAHLFQVDGRATRSALKKDGKTPVKTSGKERKAISINKDDVAQKPTLQKELPSDVQSTLSNSHDHTYSLSNSNSPIALSEEIKAQIIPVTSDSIPSKTKNLLHDLTSWKDDTTWKEAKQDLAHLFQVDGRATRSALKKEGTTPAKTSEKERKANSIDSVVTAHKPPALQKKLPDVQSNLESLDSSHQDSNSPIFLSEERDTQIVSLPTESHLHAFQGKRLLKDLTSWKHDTTWKEAKQDLAHLFQVDGRATRSALKKEGTTPAKTSEKERKANSIDSVVTAHKPPVLQKKLPDVQSNLESLVSSHQDSNSLIFLSEERDTQIVSLPTESHLHAFQGKRLLQDLTSWKHDTTWKEAKQDLANLFQVDGRATRSALKKEGTTPAKTSEKERKSHSIDSDVIAHEPPALPKKLPDVQSNLESLDSSHQDSNSPIVLSEERDTQMVSLPTESHLFQGKHLLKDLTSWKHDTTWKEAKQDLANLFQVDGRATRSALKKEGTTPAKTSEKERKANSIDSVVIAHKPPVLPKRLPDVQSNLESLDSSHQDSNSPVVLSEGRDTQMVSLPTESHLFQGKHLLKDLTSWKHDTTWKEAKQDLAHLFQVDGRATRSTLKKDAVQIEKSTALCSPAKKKRKLEYSLSRNGSSPVCPSGNTVDRIHNLSTGQLVSQEASTNEIDPEKVVQYKLPSSNGPLTKESGEIDDVKEVNEIQDHCPHSGVEKAAVMSVLPATVTIALTLQEDDVTWKETKGDLVNLSQVDGRTTRSVMCKDGEPESGTLTIEDDTSFEINGISVLTPLKKSERVNQKLGVAVETGCEDLGEAILHNEANTSPASIVKNTMPSKTQTDATHLFPLESASNLPIGAKNWSLDVRKLTAWKSGETWKEFRGEMAVLLQVDGRTTRNKAKRDGLQGICSSPKVVGKETMSSSVKKGRLLSSMPVLTKIVPDDEEIYSPTQKMHLEENSLLPSNGTPVQAIEGAGEEHQKGLNANLEIENPSSNALGPLSSNEIRLGATCDPSPYSACDIRKESAKENRKSRKRLSIVSRLNRNAEDESSKSKSERYEADTRPCHEGQLPGEMTDNGNVDSSKLTSERDDLLSTKVGMARNTEVNKNHDKGSKSIPCDVDIDMSSSKIDNIVSEADKASNSWQAVAKPIMLDRSSQTAASPEEVDGYITSMGLWYKEPNYLPPAFRRHSNFRTGYTQTYNLKYENHHTVSTPTKVLSVSIEENGFNGELTEMPELSGGEIVPQKGNCLPKTDETHVALSSLQKDVNDTMITMKQAAGKRRTYSCKKGSRRRGNSCTSPSPHLANSPKTPSVKKPRHASEPPVLSHHESVAVRDDQEFCVPNVKKSESQEVITDAGYVSHCNQDEKVALCGKSSIKEVKPGAVEQPKCRNKITQMVHQHSLIKNKLCQGASGDLDQILQTDENRKEQSSELHDSDDAVPTRISHRKKHSHSHACAQLFKEDVPAGYESVVALSETAKICRSLVDEVLGNAMKQSKCWVKRTEQEQLQSWAKDGLWKEAKDNLQTVLNAEDRITRSCRKKPKEETELGSSTPIAKPSPSLDLRKRKYCCSHMRSPWKASPAKNEAIAHGISTEPKDLQQYSPVFRKWRHHNTDGKESKTLKSLPEGNGNSTPSSMRKIWRSRVHSSKRVKQKSRKNISRFSSKKFGVPRLHTEETRKVKASVGFQRCTAKKMGRPRKQVLVIPEPEKSGISRKRLVDTSEVKKKMGRPRKYPVDITKQEKSKSPPKQVVCTSEKKKMGRPRKQHPVDVTEEEKSRSPPQQVVGSSEKKKIGRPRKQHPVDVTEEEKSAIPPQQVVGSSEKKKIRRPRKQHPVDVTEEEKSESPPKQVVCTSEKKKIGRPRKHHPVDVTEEEKSESPPKQVVCTSEKKKIGRPRKQHPADITEEEKSGSPPKQVVGSSEKKKNGRPRKQHPVHVTEEEKSGSPPKQVVDSSEKNKIGRPRKQHPVDVTEEEKSESPPKQVVGSSEKNKIGRPRKHPVDITKHEKSGSPPKQVVCTSDKKKIGRPRKQHPVDVTEEEKSECPPKQVVGTSEKKKMGRPRKYPVDITKQEKSRDPPTQVVGTSEKKKIGRPRKHPDHVSKQENSRSPPEKAVGTSEKNKMGRPRNHPINIPGQKLNCGNASKSPNNGKLSVVSGVQQSCQGNVANSRRIKKARKRLESSTIHPSTGKATVSDDLATCFMALQEVLQAGQIETHNVSTQTVATVEEVEAYVASRGKFYLEPCYMMPRPNLNRMEATSDMRTQTYNLELSQCLEDEIKRTCPPLVYDEANRPPSTLKKTNKISKCEAKQPPSTPEKVSSACISPDVSAASSPVRSSVPCTARTASSSQTETTVEEVEAYIQSMGEWYREPSFIVTGLQEARAEVKNSVRTQTYNLNLPDRELPIFKKKWSKRVQNQIKSTQTKAIWEDVNAYIEANKQLYTDPKYSTTQSYFLIGSSLTRHVPTQTYSFGLDEETSEELSKKEEQKMPSTDTESKEIPESEQTSATEKAHDYLIEPQVKPVRINGMEDGQEIDTPSHQQVKSDQSLHKPCTTDYNVTDPGVSIKIKTDSIISGHQSKKQNWFRLKPKK